MKDGTSTEEYWHDARMFNAFLRDAEIGEIDTHRHHVMPLFYELLASEDTAELWKTTRALQSRLRQWEDELSDRMAAEQKAGTRANVVAVDEAVAL